MSGESIEFKQAMEQIIAAEELIDHLAHLKILLKDEDGTLDAFLPTKDNLDESAIEEREKEIAKIKTEITHHLEDAQSVVERMKAGRDKDRFNKVIENIKETADTVPKPHFFSVFLAKFWTAIFDIKSAWAGRESFFTTYDDRVRDPNSKPLRGSYLPTTAATKSGPELSQATQVKENLEKGAPPKASGPHTHSQPRTLSNSSLPPVQAKEIEENQGYRPQFSNTRLLRRLNGERKAMRFGDPSSTHPSNNWVKNAILQTKHPVILLPMLQTGRPTVVKQINLQGEGASLPLGRPK